MNVCSSHYDLRKLWEFFTEIVDWEKTRRKLCFIQKSDSKNTSLQWFPIGSTERSSTEEQEMLSSNFLFIFFFRNCLQMLWLTSILRMNFSSEKSVEKLSKDDRSSSLQIISGKNCIAYRFSLPDRQANCFRRSLNPEKRWSEQNNEVQFSLTSQDEHVLRRSSNYRLSKRIFSNIATSIKNIKIVSIESRTVKTDHQTEEKSVRFSFLSSESTFHRRKADRTNKNRQR